MQHSPLIKFYSENKKRHCCHILQNISIRFFHVQNHVENLCVCLTQPHKKKPKLQRMNEYIFLTLIINSDKKTCSKKFKLSRELCRQQQQQHEKKRDIFWSCLELNPYIIFAHIKTQWLNKFRIKTGIQLSSLVLLCVCKYEMRKTEKLKHSPNMQHQKPRIVSAS